MNSKRLWGTTATIIALSVLDPRSSGVWAATRAMCLEGWEWNQNSLGQDPCSVLSALDANCYGDRTYVARQLGTNDTYAAPKRSASYPELKCDCDTVMYSLWLACASCQRGLIYSWTEWIPECDNGVSIAQYSHDIPQGTAIPRWAFYDVTILQNRTYDDEVAKRIGRDPEATPGQSSSSSSSASGPTNTANSSGGKTNTGVIAGSVVGGVVVVVGVVVLIVLGIAYLRRKKRKAKKLSSSTNTQQLTGSA